jgi:undecaprenyl-diphosphatase
MDEVLVRLIYDFSEAGWVDQLMIFFSSWGYKGMIVAFILMTFMKRTRKAGLAVIAGTVAGLIITRTIRYLMPRERPFVVIEDITALIPKEASASFPSEQGLIAGGFIALFWVFGGSLRWLGVVIGLLVLVSRVYLGHHYVSDVVIGALMGSFLFFTINNIVSRDRRTNRETKEILTL